MLQNGVLAKSTNDFIGPFLNEGACYSARDTTDFNPLLLFSFQVGKAGCILSLNIWVVVLGGNTVMPMRIALPDMTKVLLCSLSRI